MPPVVAVIANAVAGFVAGGIGAFVGTSSLFIYSAVSFITSTLIYAGISTLASRLISGKPKSAELPNISADYAGLLLNTDGGIQSHRIIYGTRRAGGQIFHRTTTNFGLDNEGVEVTGNNQFLHIFIAFAGHECEELTTIYFDDEALTLDGSGFVTNTRFVSGTKKYARIKKHLGSTNQTADTNAVNEIPEWTVNHRARGICYIYVRLQYNKDIWESIPRITAIIKGAKVYDPRTSTTAWSNNPALCIRDYLTSSYGFGADASTEIEDTYVIAAANACEEQVTLQDSSTQDRYTCDVVLDRNKQLIDNLDVLLSSIVGACPYVQGKFRIFAGVYNAPTVSIDETWLAGEVSVTTRQSRRELFNAVKGIYIDETNTYQPTDFPVVTNSTYETQDNGERLTKEVELSATTNQERAQRIAKVILEKGRQGIIAVFPLNFKALEVSVWDTIELTLTDLGWTNKIFRVLHWELNQDGTGMNVLVQEETSASYDWNAGEATVIDPAPDTELPSPFDVTPPGSPQITEEKYIAIQGSGTKVKAIVTWAISPDAFIVAYQLEYKLQSDTDYIVAFNGDGLYHEIFDIAPGVYDFRVKAINSIGISSAYATNTKEIVGLSDIPANITNFSINMLHNNAHLHWDLSPDLDVRVGGRIIIKHTTEIISPSWSSAVLIVPAQPGYSTHVVAPLVVGTYLIKAEDSEGNQSENAADIDIIQANVVRMNQVATSDQEPDFTGTKTNMVIIDEKLKLDGAVLFDSVSGLFDDAQGLFDGGNGAGFETSGSYEFDSYIDVGKVTTSRVTMKIKSLITDGVATFDEAQGLFDDRLGLFDGEDIDGIAINSFIRQTDDDPSGTPTWNDWRQFVAGDYTARAFEIKIEVESQDSSLNVEIEELGVEVDMPDIVDTGSGTSSASAAVTVNYNKIFVVTTPIVNVTMIAGQTGDYVSITNVDSTSFDIEIFDSGSSRVARSYNWLAQGY